MPVRQGAQDPQPKFNDSFNQHFPGLIFLKTILYEKAGEVGREINTELFLKNGTIDGYVY